MPALKALRLLYRCTWASSVLVTKYSVTGIGNVAWSIGFFFISTRVAPIKITDSFFLFKFFNTTWHLWLGSHITSYYTYNDLWYVPTASTVSGPST